MTRASAKKSKKSRGEIDYAGNIAQFHGGVQKWS